VGAAREPGERAGVGLGGAGAGQCVDERSIATAAVDDNSYGDANVFTHESRFIGPAAGGSRVAANAVAAAVCEPGDDRV